MCNVSLESFKTQYDSKVYVFKPGQATEVPAYPLDIAQSLYERLKDRGVFPIYPNMSKEDIKKAHREALLTYRGGALKERIKNYYALHDEFKKKNVTLEKEDAFEDALRYFKEITFLLEIDAPLTQKLSFLSSDLRKQIGVDDDRIQEVKPEFLSQLEEEAIREEVGANSKEEFEIKKSQKSKKLQEVSFQEEARG